MKYTKHILGLLVFLCSCNSNTELEQMLKEKVKSAELTAVAISVRKEGRVIYDFFKGYSDITTREKIDRQTLLYTGDLARILVATAIFRLIEDDLMALDDPVEKILGNKVPPYYNKEEQITVRHLLSEVSTLKDYVNKKGDVPFVNHSLDLKRLFGKKPVIDPANMWINTPIGRTYNKADLNLFLLTKIITKVSNEPYQLYIEEELLGFKNGVATFERDEIDPSRQIVTPYEFDTELNALQEKVIYESRPVLETKEGDHLVDENYQLIKSRFYHFITTINGIEWILKSLQPSNAELLSKAHTRMMLSKQVSPENTTFDIGLGTKIFRVGENKEILLVGAADCYDQMGKLMLINPMHRYSIVVYTVEPYLTEYSCINKLSNLQTEILNLIHQEYKKQLIHY